MDTEKLLLLFGAWIVVEVIKWMVTKRNQTLTELEHKTLMDMSGDMRVTVEKVRDIKREIMTDSQVQREIAELLRQVAWTQAEIAKTLERLSQD